MLARLGDLPAFTVVGFYAFAVAFAVGGLLPGTTMLIGRSAPVWSSVALLAASAVGLVGSPVPVRGGTDRRLGRGER